MKRQKKIMLSFMIAITLLLVIVVAVFAKPKDYICHQNQGSKEYSQAPVDFNSYNLHGHDGHDGDIIPPFTDGQGNSYPGKNWDAEGQAIWANGCRSPQLDPTNTPEPAATNTPVPVLTGQPTNTPVPAATNTPVPAATNTLVPNNTKIPSSPRWTPTCIPCEYGHEESYLDTPMIVNLLEPFIEVGKSVCVVGAVKGSNDNTCYSEAYVIWITSYDMQLEGIESVLNEDGTYTTSFVEFDYQNNNDFVDCEVRFTGDLDGVMEGLGYLKPGMSMVYDNWYPRMIPFVK
jgi:hypothetical protein